MLLYQMLSIVRYSPNMHSKLNLLCQTRLVQWGTVQLCHGSRTDCAQGPALEGLEAQLVINWENNGC